MFARSSEAPSPILFSQRFYVCNFRMVNIFGKRRIPEFAQESMKLLLTLTFVPIAILLVRN